MTFISIPASGQGWSISTLKLIQVKAHSNPLELDEDWKLCTQKTFTRIVVR